MSLILVALLAGAAPYPQDTAGQRSASDAAAAFTLDALPTSKQSDAPAAADEAPRSRFTVDTPIAELIADPRSKAVLDKDLPGVSDDENLDKFRTLSLRGFQPLTGGQLTDALLAKVAADLAAITPSKRDAGGR